MQRTQLPRCQGIWSRSGTSTRSLLQPNAQRDSLCHSREIPIGCEHDQVVANAELRKQGVDRPDLRAAAPAGITQLGSGNVILPVGSHERQGRETINYFLPRLRSSEALEQFLQHEAGCEQRLPALECFRERCNFGDGVRRITTQCQGPHAGVDEQIQPRDRSDL